MLNRLRSNLLEYIFIVILHYYFQGSLGLKVKGNDSDWRELSMCVEYESNDPI